MRAAVAHQRALQRRHAGQGGRAHPGRPASARDDRAPRRPARPACRRSWSAPRPLRPSRRVPSAASMRTSRFSAVAMVIARHLHRRLERQRHRDGIDAADQQRRMRCDARALARPLRHGRARSHLEARIEEVAQAVAEQVEGEHREADRERPGTGSSTAPRGRSRRRCPTASGPRPAVGSVTPRPRNDSEASARIACAMKAVSMMR